MLTQALLQEMLTYDPDTGIFTRRHANRHVRTDNQCGFKGVYWHKASQKWHARLRRNHKTISLGYFNSLHEAHSAYVVAATKYHGEFARAW